MIRTFYQWVKLLRKSGIHFLLKRRHRVFFGESNSSDDTFLFKDWGKYFYDFVMKMKESRKMREFFKTVRCLGNKIIAVGIRRTKTREFSILGETSPSPWPSLSASYRRACHAQVELEGVRNLRFLCPRSPVEIRSRDIVGATLGTYHPELRQASLRKRRRTSGARKFMTFSWICREHITFFITLILLRDIKTNSWYRQKRISIFPLSMRARRFILKIPGARFSIIWNRHFHNKNVKADFNLKFNLIIIRKLYWIFWKS